VAAVRVVVTCSVVTTSLNSNVVVKLLNVVRFFPDPDVE
jgi:hypothetical protein